MIYITRQLYLEDWYLHRLLEVRRHILLEVEVGERVLVTELEELAELGVRKDDSAIGLVLEAVCANVGSHLLGDIRARHKSTVRLAEEISELNTDLGWLDEAAWCTIALVLVLLCVELVKSLELLGDVLLKGSDLALHQRNCSGEIVKSLVDRHEKFAEWGVNSKRNNRVVNRCLRSRRSYWDRSRRSLNLGSLCL